MQALLTHTIEAENRLDNLPADDLRTGMHLRGFNLAHGELWRTMHALVMVPADATPAQRAELRARAEALHTAIAALPSPRIGAFRATATASLRGVRSRIEDLPGIDREGQFAQGSMVPPFTAAATQLQNPGDVSPVVETDFGYHVIVLVAREPPLERPADEVRAIVSQELLWRVQHRALDALLERLRAQYHADIREDALRRVDTVPLPGVGTAMRGGS
jgi:peptidyl-prolyl cis-trans isomerase D